MSAGPPAASAPRTGRVHTTLRSWQWYAEHHPEYFSPSTIPITIPSTSPPPSPLRAGRTQQVDRWTTADPSPRPQFAPASFASDEPAVSLGSVEVACAAVGCDWRCAFPAGAVITFDQLAQHQLRCPFVLADRVLIAAQSQ